LISLYSSPATAVPDYEPIDIIDGSGRMIIGGSSGWHGIRIEWGLNPHMNRELLLQKATIEIKPPPPGKALPD
jgi:hypothetical protein